MNSINIRMSHEVLDLIKFVSIENKISIKSLMKEIFNTYKSQNIISHKSKEDDYSQNILIKFKDVEELNYYKESARNISNDDFKIILNYLISPVRY